MMRRPILWITLIFSLSLLSACFRGEGTDSAQIQLMGLSGEVAQTLPTEEVSDSLPTEVATEEATEVVVTEEATEVVVTEVALLPTETPTELPPSPTETVEVVILPTETPTINYQATLNANYASALSGGSGGFIPTAEGVAIQPSPSVEVVILPTETYTPTNTPTDTPTNTPTDTPTNTPTDTPTNTPTDTPTNTPTDTPTDTPTELPTEVAALPTVTPEVLANLPETSDTAATTGIRPTSTTVTRVPFEGEIQNASNVIGSGGEGVVAQLASPTIDNSGLDPRLQTATAVVGGATATAVAQQTIAAGGDPNAGAVVQPTVGSGGVQQVQPLATTPAAQTIFVTATPVGATSADCEYLVGIGETLSEIARRYNLSADEIAIANNVTNQNLIRAGYPLIIPRCGQPNPAAVAATATSAAPTAIVPNVGTGRQLTDSTQTAPQAGQGGAAVAGATDNSQGPFQYTVQVGDNIYQLSLRYGVTMRQILASNPQILNMNLISEGQIITIPGPPTQTSTTSTTTTQPNVVVVTPATNQGGAVQPQVEQATPFTQFTPTFTPGVQG